jgi:hypothetical protein
MIDYIEEEAAHLEYSKYYNGTLEEFIKSRFDVVINCDMVYLSPLINISNDNNIILAN